MIRAVLDRMSDRVPALKMVGGTIGLEEAKKNLKVSPAAFMKFARESAERNEFQNQIVQQPIEVEFLIYTACKNLSDVTGLAAEEMLQPVRKDIRQSLINWTPDAEMYEGFEFLAGEETGFFNGVLWWGDLYRTAYLIRSD